MEFQFIGVLLAFIAVTKAHPSSVVAPVAAPLAAAPVALAAKLVDSEFDPVPQYSFAYDVHDSLTGDSKSQTESRNGDIVQGQYTVAEPDGTRRIVDYTADSINGFNAIVSKAPLAVAAPLVAKAAPIVAPAKIVAAPAKVIATPARVLAAAAPLVTAPAPVASAAAVLPANFAYTAPAPARLAYPAAPLAAPFTAPVTAPITYPAVGSLAAPISIARISYASPYAVY